jgi:hypothetical protein
MLSLRYCFSNALNQSEYVVIMFGLTSVIPMAFKIAQPRSISSAILLRNTSGQICQWHGLIGMAHITYGKIGVLGSI